MKRIYYNYSSHIAHGFWEQRQFINRWWSIFADDRRWVPPDYRDWRRAINPMGKIPHVSRMQPLLLSLEAMAGWQRQSGSINSASIFEQPVAAALILADPRRTDRTAYLCSLHGINDLVSIRRLLEVASEQLRQRGFRRLIGPVGLSPFLGSGLLQNYWHMLPPLHTAYQPPYMPEPLEQLLRPLTSQQLYQLTVLVDFPASASHADAAGPAHLTPFDPHRLATDLLPLWQAACPLPPRTDFLPMDQQEAEFLLWWTRHWPRHGWLATIEGQPVGFGLLQPDMAALLKRANGGRNPLWRLWLRWAAARYAADQGRVLFLGVLPTWRRQGIGRQLLQQMLQAAQAHGWQSLTLGPVPSTSAARPFLLACGATPHQTYMLYQKRL